MLNNPIKPKIYEGLTEYQIANSSLEEFEGYCRNTCLKYLKRKGDKSPDDFNLKLEDYKKAREMLNILIEHFEAQPISLLLKKGND